MDRLYPHNIEHRNFSERAASAVESVATAQQEPRDFRSQTAGAMPKTKRSSRRSENPSLITKSASAISSTSTSRLLELHPRNNKKKGRRAVFIYTHREAPPPHLDEVPGGL
jgi:hypothetical protein